jgi:phosphatidylglycerol lysyltransferase
MQGRGGRYRKFSKALVGWRQQKEAVLKQLHQRRGLRAALRILGPLAIAGGCLWYLSTRIGEFDHGAIAASLFGLEIWQWVFALLATWIAYLAVARQERVILRYLGHRIDRRHATGAAMAAAAVAQTVGFGPFVGAMVRVRLLPGLSLGKSFVISAATTVGFFVGTVIMALGLVATGWLGWSWAAAAWAGLGGVIWLLGLRFLRPAMRWRRWPMPSVSEILALVFWVTIDLLALSASFWVLLPLGHGMAWGEVIGIFVFSLSMGLISGSPAGTGPFEALLIVQMPGIAPEDLLAGLLAFRAVSYALPAGLGAVWALIGRALLPEPREVAVWRVAPEGGIFAGQDRAEVQLARQGDLELMRDAGGQLWATTVSGSARVLVGEPSRVRGKRALAPFLELCAFEGRPALCYKIGGRLAVEARAAGMVLLPWARDAVIDPKRHTTEGPAHAGLRRKLRHAAKAGVVVRPVQLTPALADSMDAVARDWAQRHGGERGLTTGRWAVDYVAGQRIFVAELGGDVIGFATFHATGREWVLDLMRFRTVPDGTLYLIVQRALEVARDEGVGRFSLSSVPSDGLGLKGPLGQAVQRVTGRGLWQFKSAFAPHWETRYAAASGALELITGLIGIGISLRLERVAGIGQARPIEPGMAIDADWDDGEEDLGRRAG